MYLYDPSEQARNIYYYALCVGHYLCDLDYIVKRKSFPSFLCVYVHQGKLYYRGDGGRKQEIPQGSFMLLDCYRAHEYGTLENSEIYWIHFDGSVARPAFEAIRRYGPPAPRSPERSGGTLMDIFDRTQRNGGIQEAVMNRLIVTLLTEFLVRTERQAMAGNEAIEEIRNYILENPGRELTLTDLARQANLSPYHFARLFKRQVGYSPHEYVIHARLNLARFYLTSSDRTVKQIAFSCGFSSECGFCSAFKNRLGMTPTEYRVNQQNE